MGRTVSVPCPQGRIVSTEGESEVEAFWNWLHVGAERGWVSLPVCAMHDGLPMTEEETGAIEDGFDPCVTALRLWGIGGRP